VIRQFDSPAARRILLAVFAVAAVTLMAIPVARCCFGRTTKDYALWYEVGRAVVDHQELYPKTEAQFPFMYPPPSALFLAPLSFLGKCGMIGALVLVNAAAWVASGLLAVRLVSGRALRGHALLYAIPTLAVSVFVWSNFFLGQPSLLLLALLLGAFVSLQRNRHWAAGALVGVAAGIKAFPVLAIVYLVYRRYWIAAASAILCLILLLIVLPIPVRGVATAVTDFKRWSRGMLRYDANGVAQRPARSNTWKNQSIFGVGNRLLRKVDVDATKPPDKPNYANFVDLSFATVNAIIAGCGLLLGLIYIAVMPARRLRNHESDALECALLLLLILMLTPLTFGYLFVWLLFPFALVTRKLLTRTIAENRQLLWCIVPALVLLALTIPFPRGAQIYGSLFFAALLLFVGLALELWRIKVAGRLQPSAAG
jgi:hypothetical protein